MLIPKKVKHRKWHKNPAKGKSSRGNVLSFGSFGLKAISPSWVTSRQIEAARKVISGITKRTGKVWIRIFPNKPVTKKGNEVGMGGGKGAPDHFVFNVKPGRIVFEIEGVSEELAREAMKQAGYKLPVQTKFVKK